MRPDELLGHELTAAFQAKLQQELYSLGYTNVRFVRGNTALGVILDPGCFNVQVDADGRITRYWVG